MNYKETQYGLIFHLIFLGVGMILTGFYFFHMNDELFHISQYLTLMAVLAIVVILFYKFVISIDDKTIQLSYGIGIISTKIRPENIHGLSKVKVPFYFGLGIRFTPKGVLYNIKNNDAILMKYSEGGKNKTIMIGSDQCEKLIEAINSLKERIKT